MPISPLTHGAVWSVALLWPHTVHRAHWRSTSLDVSAPHRMMSGASARGARWRQGDSDPDDLDPAGRTMEFGLRLERVPLAPPREQMFCPAPAAAWGLHRESLVTASHDILGA
jgi:hypothetical protein